MRINYIYSKLLLGLVLLLIGVSCAGPKLTNFDQGQYKTQELENPQEILAVNVNVIPMPTPPSSPPSGPKTFFDLKDSIPHTYLKVIGEKASDEKAVIEAIKAPLSVQKKLKNTSSDGVIRHDELKVRLWFSNIKKYYNRSLLLHPNTRLDFLNTTVQLESDNVYIKTIDRLENEFEQIDMGTLNRTQNVSFGANVTGEVGTEFGNEESKTKQVTDSTETGQTVKETKKSTSQSGGANAKAQLDYTNEVILAEAVKMNFKKLKTSYSFTPKQLVVSQRGRPMVDISDNVSVILTLKFKNEHDNIVESANVKKFNKLYTKSGDLYPIDSIEISNQQVVYVKDTGLDLKFNVKYEGSIRAVENSKKGMNMLEYDDQVVYYTFESDANTSVIEIDNFEFTRRCYKIVADVDGQQYTLYLNSGELKQVKVFDDGNPESVRLWLKRLIDEGSKSKLVSKKYEFVFKNCNNEIFLSHRDSKRIDLEILKSIGELRLRVLR